jgi:uncharacterized protein (TIGR01777 family)
VKIVIAGGSGQVGQVLERGLTGNGHHVTILSRSAVEPQRHWDGKSPGEWYASIDGADAVINLAGLRVHSRSGNRDLSLMLTSRTLSTRAIGRAIAAAKTPPPIWLQASTATLYAHRLDAPNDDFSGPIAGEEPDVPVGWKARVELAKAWERELDLAPTPGTRKVALRSAITLSAGAGGAFDIMARLAKRGLLGTAGNGRQFVSWIHEYDFVRSIEFLLNREDLKGPIILASPNPVPNKLFNRTLREALHARIGIPASGFVLSIGAYFADGDSELVLKSRYVVPTKLLQAGFEFRYPEWQDAAAELATRWIAQNPSLWQRMFAGRRKAPG